MTGKDLKRVIASNLPLEFGINETDLHDYITLKSMEKEGYPVDLGIKEIAINQIAGYAVIEVADKVMTQYIEKLDGEDLLGHTIRFQ